MVNLDIPLIGNTQTQKNVRTSMKLINQLTPASFQELIKLAINYLHHGCQLDSNHFMSLKEDKISDQEFKAFFQNLIILLRHCLRYQSSLKAGGGNLSDILSEEFRIPQSLSETVQKELQAIQASKLIPKGPKLASCRSIRWRIDVIVSSNVLSKILEPLVVFELITDSGEKIKFDCSLVKFNQLRLAVAMALREFYRLEEKRSAIAR